MESFLRRDDKENVLFLGETVAVDSRLRASFKDVAPLPLASQEWTLLLGLAPQTLRTHFWAFSVSGAVPSTFCLSSFGLHQHNGCGNLQSSAFCRRWYRTERKEPGSQGRH